MLEDQVVRIAEIFLSALTSGKNDAIKQLLRAGFVVLRDEGHGKQIVARGTRRLRALMIVPPREHAGKTLHHRLIVCRDRQALVVELERSVGLKLAEANRKKLQDLTGVVFV